MIIIVIKGFRRLAILLGFPLPENDHPEEENGDDALSLMMLKMVEYDGHGHDHGDVGDNFEECCFQLDDIC